MTANDIITRLEAFFKAVRRERTAAGLTRDYDGRVFITRLSPEAHGAAERSWPDYVAAAQAQQLAITMTIQHRLDEMAIYTEAGANPAVRSESSRDAFLYLRPLA